MNHNVNCVFWWSKGFVTHRLRTIVLPPSLTQFFQKYIPDHAFLHHAFLPLLGVRMVGNKWWSNHLVPTEYQTVHEVQRGKQRSRNVHGPALQESGRTPAHRRCQVARAILDSRTEALSSKSFPFDRTPEAERNMLPEITQVASVQSRFLQGLLYSQAHWVLCIYFLAWVGKAGHTHRKGT